ncbi:MAG: ANTAR domain-containing response regulator [Thermincolia bacterium]
MKSLSILIAEDQSLTRMDLKEMLETAGHLVCANTNNGLKAVELAKQLNPDLALLDIKMPGMDGLDVAKVMHSLNIPVIILTAYSQPNFINRAEKVHVANYLVKPITERDLLPAVQITYAQWKEMQSVREQLQNVQNTLESQKIIAHARLWLAKEDNISEYEAHVKLIKTAMNRRITLIELANELLKISKI